MKDAAPYSDIDALLDRALPPESRGHVLALGEHHTLPQHVEFLHQQADKLMERHGVRTLALEASSALNPWIWAYRDGALPVPANEQEHYLKRMFSAFHEQHYEANNRAVIDLAAKMLGATPGMRVVCYDSRRTLGETAHNIRHYLSDFEAGLQQESAATGQSVAAIEQRLRTDNSALEQLRATHWPQAPLSFVESTWALHETRNLLETHPDYAQRLDRMERLIAASREQGASEDAASAVLLHAASAEDGNTLVVCGLDHLRGIDRNKGMLDTHLAALAGREHVAKALLSPQADTALYRPPHHATLPVSPVPIYALDSGAYVGDSLPANPEHIPPSLPHTAQALNPLLHAEVAAASCAVRESEHAAWAETPKITGLAQPYTAGTLATGTTIHR